MTPFLGLLKGKELNGLAIIKHQLIHMQRYIGGKRKREKLEKKRGREKKRKLKRERKREGKKVKEKNHKIIEILDERGEK